MHDVTPCDTVCITCEMMSWSACLTSYLSLQETPPDLVATPIPRSSGVRRKQRDERYPKFGFCVKDCLTVNLAAQTLKFSDHQSKQFVIL